MEEISKKLRESGVKNYRNLTICGDKIIVDGIPLENYNDAMPGVKSIEVVVNGDLDSLCLQAGDCKMVSGGVGEIRSGSGNVTCGDVSGSVSTGSGIVRCGNVKGSVNTGSGNVTCGDVGGRVMTIAGAIFREGGVR